MTATLDRPVSTRTRDPKELLNAVQPRIKHLTINVRGVAEATDGGGRGDKASSEPSSRPAGEVELDCVGSLDNAAKLANATLAATLQTVTDPLQRPTDSWLRLREDLTPADWRAARDNVGENFAPPDVDRRAVRGLRFSAALPERLAVATVAARLADFESARSVLGESARFQYDG